jgi:predicted nucleic acid-binding protein
MPSSVESLLETHQRIAVDSNVLIYLLESDDRRADPAARIVDAVAERRNVGILASLGIVEILVASALRDDGAGFERTGAAIRDVGFDIVALDADAAEDAAWIRGRSGASLPDAVHLACAMRGGATILVTNDRRMPSIRRLQIAYLDDLIG